MILNNIFIVVAVLAMMIGPRYSMTTTILGHTAGGGGSGRRHGRVVIKIGGNAFPCRLVVGSIGPGRIIRDGVRHHHDGGSGRYCCGSRVHQLANVGRRIYWDARI